MRGSQPPAGDLIRRGALPWMMRLERVQRQRGAHRNRLDHRPDRLENCAGGRRRAIARPLRHWSVTRRCPLGDFSYAAARSKESIRRSVAASYRLPRRSRTATRWPARHSGAAPATRATNSSRQPGKRR